MIHLYNLIMATTSKTYQYREQASTEHIQIQIKASKAIIIISAYQSQTRACGALFVMLKVWVQWNPQTTPVRP